MWTAKITSYLTLAVFLPLILVGLISIALVHILDYVGQYALWPAHKITNWLHDYQQNQIRSAHNILSLDEIQSRTGNKDEDL